MVEVVRKVAHVVDVVVGAAHTVVATQQNLVAVASTVVHIVNVVVQKVVTGVVKKGNGSTADDAGIQACIGQGGNISNVVVGVVQ